MGEQFAGRFGSLASTVNRGVAAIERRALLMRWLLAGPGALVAGTLVMAAMPVWLPSGAAGIDNIVYPLILAPLIWAAVFTYTILEQNLARGVVVVGGTILSKGTIVALAVTGVIHGGGA